MSEQQREGIWCPACRRRIPLAQAGEHELEHDETGAEPGPYKVRPGLVDR